MSLGVVVLVGNWQRGSFPTGVIVLQGSCPWGSCPQGSCPRGSCPRGSCHRTENNCLALRSHHYFIDFLLFALFQSFHEEIADMEGQLDAVNEKAQGLLQTTSDSRLTSQLTQLNSRYGTLVSLSKVVPLNVFGQFIFIEYLI